MPGCRKSIALGVVASLLQRCSADEACCLDPSITHPPPIPSKLDQNANQHNITVSCTYSVSWVMSDYLLDILNSNKVDPGQFKFRVCSDERHDPEVRRFPWVHSTTQDWVDELAWEGSVMLNPMDLMGSWLDGYQQVMPDAIDYFCRMGEVTGLKIVPKFMLYGWSKGAIANWPLGRWRSDIVQAVVSVHGCDSPKYYTKDHDVKAKGDGMSPYLFFSSYKDGYLMCSPGDTMHQYQNQLKYQPLTYHVETPCGHHPQRCWPVCDYNKTYDTPFWEFVDTSYAYQSCITVTSKETCESYLCKWDSELGVCAEAHPTRFTPSCAKFCDLELVALCDGLEAEACAKSYIVIPEEDAAAKGMHSRCALVEGACAASSESAQCFFQDQCPGGEHDGGDEGGDDEGEQGTTTTTTTTNTTTTTTTTTTEGGDEGGEGEDGGDDDTIDVKIINKTKAKEVGNTIKEAAHDIIHIIYS